jgi:hypothetical protein
MSAPHITEIRTALLETLRDLRSQDKPMDIDRAKAVALVASTLIDSARVEVDFLKATGQTQSEFLGVNTVGSAPALTSTGSATVTKTPTGIVHRMVG